MPQAPTTETESLPPQSQSVQPGREEKMRPRPEAEARRYQPAGKLEGKVALITGGDSGIGRAVAVAFAKEGAQIAIVYLEEEEDARQTMRLIEDTGGEVIGLAGDIGDDAFCRHAVDATLARFGHLDILVNNAAEQHLQNSIEDLTAEQVERTFRTNVFGMFHMTSAAVPHMKPGSRIINTTSVTAYRGSAHLVDYSATKGAIVSFTRSLALQLAPREIHVNAVAPGPVWTPLIPASFPPEKVSEFGEKVPLKRPAQPDEIAPCYVLLASSDSSFMTGQVLHPNGGEIING